LARAGFGADSLGKAKAMPEETTPTRGSFSFEVVAGGGLLNSARNVENLRKLWLNRQLVQVNDLGPGDPGDFDHGAWHSSCHLLGAGGVRRASDGRLIWLEISHLHNRDEYFAIATVRDAKGIRTVGLDSAEGRLLLEGSSVLGFVEGNSTGRTSARAVFDSPDRFNLWRRQDFDQPITSSGDGGKVWEHWCTTRDLRPANAIGTSVLVAYVSLTAALGDLFPSMVARGRREYGHPRQLCAMIRSGLVDEASAICDINPRGIPDLAARLLLEADPERSLLAVESLDWSSTPCYYMFARRIESWSKAKDVMDDLKKFPS
jgi:hypothetical protein